jgi:L-ascorbate metabolism protein UlaG (beta-lactamase superfamily)
MLITKYTHACLVLEQDSKSLVIDPGSFSEDFQVPNDVVAIVITHEHPDHFSVDNVIKIHGASPDATLYATQTVIDQLPMFTSHVILAGEEIQQGPFSLAFYGEKHAFIAPGLPICANVGVLVNNELFYGGDAFTVPEQKPRVLALPASGPWFKMSEAFDYIDALKPSVAFPTHDAILSDIGMTMADRMLASKVETEGGHYRRLDLGKVYDIASL